MKHEHYNEYTGQDTERAEAALLTAWAVLADFHPDLVLIGGLVPRYICRTPLRELQPVTIAKDVFDLVRTVRHYDSGGPDAAAKAFHAEKDVNAAYNIAMQTLKNEFGSPRSKGPVQYADFCLGAMDTASSDVAFLREQRINETLDMAQLLSDRSGQEPLP